MYSCLATARVFVSANAVRGSRLAFLGFRQGRIPESQSAALFGTARAHRRKAAVRANLHAGSVTSRQPGFGHRVSLCGSQAGRFPGRWTLRGGGESLGVSAGCAASGSSRCTIRNRSKEEVPLGSLKRQSRPTRKILGVGTPRDCQGARGRRGIREYAKSTAVAFGSRPVNR